MKKSDHQLDAQRYAIKVERNDRTIGMILIIIGLLLLAFYFRDDIMAIQNRIADNCIQSGGSYLGGHCIHK